MAFFIEKRRFLCYNKLRYRGGSSMDVKERINELKEKLNEASVAYYVNDNPIMEDYEYDRLMEELIHLEEENPSLKTDRKSVV